MTLYSSNEDKTEIFPMIGTVIGIFVNLSPGILFAEIVKNQRIYTEIPESMLLSNLLCNCINLSLGFVRMDYIMILSSSVGAFLAIVWAIWYLFYFSEDNIKMFLIHSFVIVNLSVEFVWIFGFIIKSNLGTGIGAIIITVINFATPGQNILKVIRTKKHKLIPIFTTVTCLLCSSCWLIYGITEFDYRLYVPNVLGLLFGLLQFVVWAIFFCKKWRFPKGEIPKNIPNSPNYSRVNFEDTLTNDNVD